MINFICLGAPKCGTSSLYQILNQNRMIVFPQSGKNAYFYGYNKKDWSRLESRYFPVKAKKNKKYGMVAENWYGNVEPGKLAKALPKNVKVIFIVRNPVSRCFSDYKFLYAWHGIQGKDEKDYYKYNHSRAFEKYVKKHLNDTDCKLLRAGLYYEKIHKYYEELGQENIKVIFLEEIISLGKEVYLDLFNFLGIKEYRNINYDIKVNEGKYIPRTMLAGKIYGIFRTQFLQNTLEWKYGICERSENIKSLYNVIISKTDILLKNDEDRTKISENTRMILENYYREDKKKLEKLLNKNLDELWYK